VTLRWRLVTGTWDTTPVGGETMQDGLAVFDALRQGGEYKLVLDGGEQHGFTDGLLRRGSPKRALQYHLAFWRAYLLSHPETRRWVDGEGPGDLLDPRDDWYIK
jgi:hypothetical protein